MRSLSALLALTVLVLSGCSASDDGSGSDPGNGNTGDDTTEPRVTGTSRPPTQSSTSGGPTSQQPTPGNEVPAIVSFVATGASGAAPLEVSFTFEASDADGDTLEWTLDFGDGSEPAGGMGETGEETHTFTTAGTYTAALTVSDGKDETEQVIGIEVTSGAPTDFEPISAVLTAVIWCEPCTTLAEATGEGTVNGCAGWNAGQKGQDCNWMEIPAEAAGRDWTVTSADGSGALGANPQVAFLDACAVTANQLLWVDETTTESEEGAVPSGALCMFVTDFYGAELTFTLDIV